MSHRFTLSGEQLSDIARLFRQRMAEGLAADGKEIKGLLTYVPVSRPPADGRPVVVVDLGGTRVRAAVMVFRQGRAEVTAGPRQADLPVRRGEPLALETFLEVQVGLVQSLAPPDGSPLGYCFSYPAVPGRDRDAVLLNWTKEIFVPETEGRPVGRLLLEALARGGVNCSSVTVLNDTVASLLSGVPGPRADAHLGLIVGTGTNLAALFREEQVPKFPAALKGWKGGLPVNLESGNFTPPYLNEMDDAVDAASGSSAGQRFEKAVSGVYLGRLLKAAVPAAPLDPEQGSLAVVELAQRDPGQAGSVARAILTRSARLVAATLYGLTAFLRPQGGRVRIVAEGGLFWGAPGYADQVEETLAELLEAGLGEEMPETTIVRVDNANLVGTATAALSYQSETTLSDHSATSPSS